MTGVDGETGVNKRWVGSRCAVTESSVDDLSHRILRLANAPIPRTEFLKQTLGLIAEATASREVEIWVAEDECCARATLASGGEIGFARLSCPKSRPQRDDTVMPSLLCEVARGADSLAEDGFAEVEIARTPGVPSTRVRSLVFPLHVGKDPVGWLRLGIDAPSDQMAESLDQLVQTLSLALVSQHSQAALRERVKELTCLYAVSRLTKSIESPISHLMQGVADLLPSAWQYPEVAVCRIELGEASWTSGPGGAQVHLQSADLVVRGESRGRIEVWYCETQPEMDEGPFLAEERSLLDAVAREVASSLEARHAAEERERLHEQLLHADRLATIGQLASGMAHELNEPLGAVLGFAQLARASGELQPQADDDLAKIEAAALHAREIVKKLMFFARQTPTRTDPVNVNRVVEDVLYFLEARCAKRSIRVNRDLYAGLPEIAADVSQIQQVLVNLVVNAIHAMPGGGSLTISTASDGGSVVLRVVDDGCGMSDEVREKVFLPFFTTKDVGEGTGLGLSVVHGIVAAHGGEIGVRSSEGEGTVFEVEFPVLPAVSPRDESA